MEADHSFFEVGVVLFELCLVALSYHLKISGALFMLRLVFFCVVILKLDHKLVTLRLE